MMEKSNYKRVGRNGRSNGQANLKIRKNSCQLRQNGKAECRGHRNLRCHRKLRWS
ncbi:hypothetical protein Hdeb2414_s0021g00572011 [Helianthus debilis subsp. tardiflorus]